MARLNEPSMQTESVEALKRRFVRQNREIARVNSTQSLRIRNLESEVSRLLSENITLREQVIKLQFEIDNNVGSDSISSVKGRLEIKLVELGGLVLELGNLQQSAEDRRAIRRRSGVKSSPKKSPDQRNWKNALSISEVTGGADGRLPPIVEGKYYPRRTLDADEVLELLPNTNDLADSPELGPPPVAHFEAGDPIEFDANQQGSPRKARLEGAGRIDPALLVNLETRRKRRESSQLVDDTVAGSINPRKTQQEEIPGHSRSEPTLKSGAKRKFSAREDDEYKEAPDAPLKDDFQYNRTQENRVPENPSHKETEQVKPASVQPGKHVGQKIPHDLARKQERPRGRPRTNIDPMPSNRSVLAPKSVNTDPVSSPTKTNRPVEGEKAILTKPDTTRPRDRSRTRDQPASQRFARPAKTSQSEAPEAKASEQSLQSTARSAPKTPAPSSRDTFSPDGSEPPPSRPEGRDTPPPADLDPETANGNAFGSLGRASRRQRGSVSYAEPNLRDKMRRPTKELVDAVGADGRMKERKPIKSEDDAPDAEPIVTGEAPSKLRTVVIKKEPPAEDGLDWKVLPLKARESDQDNIRTEAPSPLGKKSAAVKADLPSSVVTERRRRPSILGREKLNGEGKIHESGSSSAIAALMTENPKSRPREYDVRADQSKEISRPAETPGIYDVQGNSRTEVEHTNARARETKAAAARTSRRHSSISDDRIKDAMAGRAEKRKDIVGEIRTSSKVSGPLDLKNVRSAATLAVEAGEGLQGRGERAASRRRSMML